MRIGLVRYKNMGSPLRMIRANRFARIALRIARATKLRTISGTARRALPRNVDLSFLLFSSFFVGDTPGT